MLYCRSNHQKVDGAVLTSPKASWLWTALSVVLLGFLCLRLVPSFMSRDDSLERLRRQGVLRVGYTVGPPFVSLEGGHSPRGSAVDDIPAIARSLGINRVEWVQADYQSLIPDLLDRRFDVVASQLGISREREALVRFSRPVVSVSYGVLVPRGNPQHIDAYGLLRPRPGQVVALTRQSVAEAELRRRGFTDSQLMLVSVGESGESTLRVGVAQALVRTVPSLEVIARMHPGEFELLRDPEGSPAPAMSMAYAFHPADDALRKAWDDYLNRRSAERPAR